MQIVKQELNDRGGLIIFEAPTYEELDGGGLQQAAITAAGAAGCTKPGISTDSGIYPVDPEGNQGEAMLKGQVKAAAFRRDFKLLGGV